ncbi:MAG: thioredoxin family protein [Bacteroidetes bacterium]|nr:thioredoxin family protein [Bacteroidota bacterium]
MKKIIIAIISIICFQQAEAQTDTIPIYKKYPEIPVFDIMIAPDSTKFTKDDLKKKKPTIIMLFSPDCEHCKHATKDLLEHIDLFKKAQIVMVASLNFDHIKKFYDEFKLADYPNIIVGRDSRFYLGTLYKIHNYPSLFVYNKKGKFVKSFDSSVKMEELADAL